MPVRTNAQPLLLVYGVAIGRQMRGMRQGDGPKGGRAGEEGAHEGARHGGDEAHAFPQAVEQRRCGVQSEPGPASLAQ